MCGYKPKDARSEVRAQKRPALEEYYGFNDEPLTGLNIHSPSSFHTKYMRRGVNPVGGWVV
jgi:hypothetical protein